ncbi:MAG: hypothetical protein M1828_003341 [Chrysothrix sp. TS-e1954]|nr:MAG: hypothetical protein M1828_003341 [Chrysothrix sp. TS-e1954]
MYQQIAASASIANTAGAEGNPIASNSVPSLLPTLQCATAADPRTCTNGTLATSEIIHGTVILCGSFFDAPQKLDPADCLATIETASQGSAPVNFQEVAFVNEMAGLYIGSAAIEGSTTDPDDAGPLISSDSPVYNTDNFAKFYASVVADCTTWPTS